MIMKGQGVGEAAHVLRQQAYVGGAVAVLRWLPRAGKCREARFLAGGERRRSGGERVGRTREQRP